MAVFDLNKTNGLVKNDYLLVAGELSVGNSILTATNLGPALVAGDSFILFSQPASGISTLNLPPLNNGLAWTNRLAIDGSIAVLSTIPSAPTNLIYTVNGGTLTLNWPSNYTGWILQAQTNPLSTGLQPASNAWFDVPGSASLISTNEPIVPANPSVFYRLRHP
jgi:hypothetical protein